ncbi:MAG: hypothetical protein PVSMB11_11120 [Desulfuromonadaceae bacterium]
MLCCETSFMVAGKPYGADKCHKLEQAYFNGFILSIKKSIAFK